MASVLFGLLLGLAFVAGTVRYVAVGALDESYAESMWQGFSRLIDVSSLQRDEGFGARVASVLFTLLGVLAAATITAVVITEFQRILERARNGRTTLTEAPDLVLLGWSPNLEAILVELSASATTSRLAILSSRQRSDAADNVRSILKRTRATSIVVHCREGDPEEPDDLAMVRISEARAVIVVSEHASDDSAVIKGIFAAIRSGVDPGRQIVVAEVRSREAATAIRMVTGDRVKTVNSQEVLALVLAQATRDVGMSQVIQELFSYRGCEIYFHHLPEQLVGGAFGSVLLSISNARPIGYARGGVVCVNPPFDDVMISGDELIVVQQTLVTLEHARVGYQSPRGGPVHRGPTVDWPTQNILLLGWSVVLESTLEHLRGFLGAGSRIVVAIDEARLGPSERSSLARSERSAVIDEVARAADMHDLVDIAIDLTGSRHIDALAILPHREMLTAAQSDADTLILLAAVQNSRPNFQADLRLVAELREARASDLAELVSPDDLIISESLAASLIVQLVDRPELDPVLADLLDYHGSAIFVKAKEQWPHLRRSGRISFDEIIHEVVALGEVPIGWRVGRTVELNPDRDGEVDAADLTAVVVIGNGAPADEDGLASTISDVGRMRKRFA